MRPALSVKSIPSRVNARAFMYILNLQQSKKQIVGDYQFRVYLVWVVHHVII